MSKKKFTFNPKIFIIVLIFFFQAHSLFAQKYSTRSQKAIKRFTEALDLYRNYRYTEATNEIYAALRADSSFVEAYHLLSDIYGQTGEDAKKIQTLRKAIAIAPEFSAFAYLNLARTEYSNGLYDDALKNAVEFEKRNKIPEYFAEIKKLKEKARFGSYALKHPSEFRPLNLGKNINSELDEYHPMLTGNAETLIFTKGILRAGLDSVRRQTDTQEDFYITVRDSAGFWTKAETFGSPLNTNRNEGAHTVTGDGRTMYFTACEDVAGYNPHGTCYGRCDIYKVVFSGNTYSKPENIGKKINTSHKETQPCVTPDGRTMFFVSDRPGGKGGLDIWKTRTDAAGLWQTPVNLGDSINTAGDEVSPFIAADSKTLYFSSSGHAGMGGFDLYLSRLDTTGTWTKPLNLGYPINTYADQTGLSLNAEGTKGYFAADYKGGFGRKDIYEFELPQSIRPEPAYYAEGRIYDISTRIPLETRFNLIDLKTGDTIASSLSGKKDGKFFIILPLSKTYAFITNKKAYLPYSENFDMPDNGDSVKVKYLDIPLIPIQTGTSIVLKNIFFDFDKSVLKPESFIEIDALAEYIKNQSGIRFEIGGHTDNTGTAKRNEALSDERARAVFNELIKRGVDSKILTSRGYADKVPIASNDTPEGRAQNRRTELKVIESK